MSGFNIGDKVRINPTSVFYGERSQLPSGVIGVIDKFITSTYQLTPDYRVSWGLGTIMFNYYGKDDLIFVEKETFTEDLSEWL